MPLTPDIARQLGLRGNVSGLVVQRRRPGRAAAEAGIQPGDVIVEANRQPVRSAADFQKALGKSGTNIVLGESRRPNFVYDDPALAAAPRLGEAGSLYRLLRLAALGC